MSSTVLTAEADSPESIVAILSWEQARVGDPAEDFAQIVQWAAPGAVDTVFEAYAHARTDRPDDTLLERAELAGQMASMRGLVRAVASSNEARISAHRAVLVALDEELSATPATADEDTAADDELLDADELADAAPEGDVDDDPAGGEADTAAKHSNRAAPNEAGDRGAR